MVRKSIVALLIASVTCQQTSFGTEESRLTVRTFFWKPIKGGNPSRRYAESHLSVGLDKQITKDVEAEIESFGIASPKNTIPSFDYDPVNKKIFKCFEKQSYSEPFTVFYDDENTKCRIVMAKDAPAGAPIFRKNFQFKSHHGIMRACADDYSYNCAVAELGTFSAWRDEYEGARKSQSRAETEKESHASLEELKKLSKKLLRESKQESSFVEQERDTTKKVEIFVKVCGAIGIGLMLLISHAFEKKKTGSKNKKAKKDEIQPSSAEA